MLCLPSGAAACAAGRTPWPPSTSRIWSTVAPECTTGRPDSTGPGRRLAHAAAAVSAGAGGAGHSASDSERELLSRRAAEQTALARARGGGRVDGRRRRPREEAAASRRGGIKGLTRVSWDGGWDEATRVRCLGGLGAGPSMIRGLVI